MTIKPKQSTKKDEFFFIVRDITHLQQPAWMRKSEITNQTVVLAQHLNGLNARIQLDSCVRLPENSGIAKGLVDFQASDDRMRGSPNRKSIDINDEATGSFSEC